MDFPKLIIIVSKTEVLDDFNGPKEAANVSSDTPRGSTGLGDVDEEELMKQLEADMMANLLGGLTGSKADKGKTPTATTTGTGSQTIPEDADLLTGVADTELEDLASKLKELQAGGFDMDDFLKGVLGSEGLGAGKSNAAGNSAAGIERGETFQDTIDRTLERMQESGDKATAEATKPDLMNEESIGQFLKLLNTSVESGGDANDIEKMFDSLVKEMSNKEMLYEPMKDHHAKYGPWLEENRSKVSPEDLIRYETQARLVKEIVEKFEEKDYSDEKPECLEYIWNRMQQVPFPFSFPSCLTQFYTLSCLNIMTDYEQMEAVGPPPEEIMENPLAGVPGFKNGGDAVPPECATQ